MSHSLLREQNGRVILRSDNVALRFFTDYGGAPLEWWPEPEPLLTDPFPGAGVSINWEVGQDPTQASSNGLSPHPICRFDDPVGTERYNYYARESVFDAENGRYETTGFYPDFWLSHEAPDDAFAPNPATGGGWRTLYAPGSYPVPATGVVFQGSKTFSKGFFFPGNELEAATWYERARKYTGGRFAGRLCVWSDGTKDAVAGIAYRIEHPASAAATGYRLVINQSTGNWEFYKAATRKLKGALTKAAKAKFINGTGLFLEVRTNNCAPGENQLWVDDKLVGVYQDDIALYRGAYAAICAQTSKGALIFGHRAFFDVGIEAVSSYQAMPGGMFESDLSIRRAGCSDSTPEFYRANLPGFFLNTAAFIERQTLVNGAAHESDIVMLQPGMKLWAGRPDGHYGIECELISAQVNGEERLGNGAHALLSKHAACDGFVLMLNPFSYGRKEPAHSARVVARWRTYRS